MMGIFLPPPPPPLYGGELSWLPSVFSGSHDIHIVHVQVFLCQTHDVFGGAGADLVDSLEVECIIQSVIKLVFQCIGLGEKAIQFPQ